MALPSIEYITNMYLYGQSSKPSNMLSASIVPPHTPLSPIVINTEEYMASVGRFAVGAQFDFIQKFFDSGNTIAPREEAYSKDEILEILGYDLEEDFFGWDTHQAYWQDETDDYAYRNFIFGSSSFKVNDNATFLVAADGTRTILNYSIVPNETTIPDNFDFSGNGISWAANLLLNPIIDPSNIGSKLVFDYTTPVSSSATYTLTQYQDDTNDIVDWYTADLVKLVADGVDMLNGLWNSGSTKFLDVNNRPILYGTDGSDTIDAGSSSNVWTSSANLLGISNISQYKNNGTVLVAGNGADTLNGSNKADQFYGGSGQDIAYGYNGNDVFYGNGTSGGLDGDTYSAGLNNDVVNYSGITGYGIYANMTGVNGSVQKYSGGSASGSSDNLTSVEAIIGTSSADKFVSSGGSIIFAGGAGSDVYDMGTYSPGSRIQENQGDAGTDILVVPSYVSPSTYERIDYSWGSRLIPKEGETGVTVNVPKAIEGVGLSLSSYSLVSSFPLKEEDDDEEDGDDGDGGNGNAPGDIPAWLLSPSNQFKFGPTGLSPLVLDLDGDGVEVTRLGFRENASTVYFDMDVNGFAERTAWVTGGDGMLAIDLNSNGIIDNHGELFGNTSIYADGFAKLASLDSNSSGTITSADSQWSALRVWIDADEDGVTDSGELVTLSSLGITSFDLSATPLTNTSLNENTVTATSTYTMGGITHTVSDVWFSTDQSDTRYQADVALDVRALFLPSLKGFGNLPDLHVAMSLDEDLLDLVTDFVTNWDSELFGDPAALNAAVDAILYKWADTETATITTFSYSYPGPAPYDTREYSFMEKITGKAYDPSYYALNEPAVFDILHNSYVMMRESLKAHLVLQAGGAGDLFSEAPVYNIASGEITGGVLDTDLLDDLSNEASLAASAHDYWQSVVSLLLEVKIAQAYSSADIAALETAIQASDPLLTWAGLVADVYALNGGVRLEDWRINYTEDYHSVHLVGTNNGDEVNGGAHNDWLVGRDGDDLMNGLVGNDRIEGGGGNDTIQAGDGDDTVVYEYGLDTLSDYGGIDTIQILTEGMDAGDLTLTRTSGNQYSLEVYLNSVHILTLLTQFGDLGGYEAIRFADDSTFDLSAVQYTTTGTSGADTLYGIASGGAGDIIDGLGGADTIYGYAGNDTINGGSGLDAIDGGLGNDIYKIDYNSGKDTITDDGGSDKILFGSGYTSGSMVLSRSGSDLNIVMSGTTVATFVSHFDYTQDRLLETVEFYGGTIIDVSAISFTQNGTSGSDTINGHNGRDTISGVNGADYLNGYGGSDTINGGSGTDTLWGGNGADLLYGDNDNDVIYGEAGNDTLDGGSGNDSLYGGTGDDLYVVNVATDTVYENADEGIDTIQSAVTLTLASEVENLTLTGSGNNSGTGNALNNVLLGNTGTNTLSGGDGNDTLTGGAGADTLYGQNDTDLLIADAGIDTMYGGSGADTFKFSTATLDGSSDFIKDYSAGDSDVIDVKDILVGYDPLTKLITDYVEMTTSGANTIMRIDRDGLGSTYSWTQVARIDGVTGMTDEASLESSGRLVAV